MTSGKNCGERCGERCGGRWFLYCGGNFGEVGVGRRGWG